MALRAGYKGIKKKYADPINNGQGDPGGGGLSDWVMVGEPVVGTSEVLIPESAKEIIIVAEYNTGSFNVGASMIICVQPLSDDVIYFDFGAGSQDAFFVRYGITKERILLNTAKSNNVSVLANTVTRMYYR